MAYYRYADFKKLKTLKFPFLTDTYTVMQEDGSYEDLTAGNAERLTATVNVVDQVPYLFRASGGSADIGNREYDTLVGGCVAWNQLCENSKFNGTPYPGDASVTYDSTWDTITYSGSMTQSGQSAVGYVSKSGRSITKDHVYVLSFKISATNATHVWGTVDTNQARNLVPYREGYFTFMQKSTATGSGNRNWMLGVSAQANTIVTATFSEVNVFDLTQMFGTAIADYVYSLESATPGSGVAWFRNLFPKPYYEYCAGGLIFNEVQQHITVGFNAYEHFDTPYVSYLHDGALITGKAKLVGGQEYQITGDFDYLYLHETSDSESIPFVTISPDGNGLFIPPYTGWLFVTWGSESNTCVHLTWSGYRNGEYEPYVKRTYTIDSGSLTSPLLGIPKLDADNQLYYDGDTYEADGTVTRRYGIVDLGTLTDWALSQTDGHNRFYSAALHPLVKYASKCLICPKFVLATSHSSNTFPGNNMIATSGTSQSLGRVWFWSDDYVDAAAFETAVSGVYLVYELATPTTETATPFASPQIVDDWGTEEYVVFTTSDPSITSDLYVELPVGHLTRYPANLRDKLQHLPDLSTEDGTYAISQDGTQMALIPIPAAVTDMPDIPGTDGNYALKVTVTDGVPIYFWAAQ